MNFNVGDLVTYYEDSADKEVSQEEENEAGAYLSYQIPKKISKCF